LVNFREFGYFARKNAPVSKNRVFFAENGALLQDKKCRAVVSPQKSNHSTFNVVYVCTIYTGKCMGG